MRFWQLLGALFLLVMGGIHLFLVFDGVGGSLGAMFVLVTLLMPRGIIGTLQAWWAPWQAQRAEAKAEKAEREAAAPQPDAAE